MEITRDTRVLVTGANGGIGTAIARALHAEGAQLVLSGRRGDALQPLAAELGARVVVADLQHRADVNRCVDEAGPVDVLVANAGMPASGLLLEFTPDQLERSIDVNLLAPMIMAHRLVDGMLERGRGHLVFISSLSAKIAAQGSSVYAAGKFGVRGFALGLREDLRGRGVGVTTIFPGFIRGAGMFADTGLALPRGSGTRSPEDVARAVLRGIHKNVGEITVASGEQKFGAFLAGLSHSLVTAMGRMLGGDELARQIAEKQKHKR